MARTKGRVVLPKGVKERLDLAQSICTKHQNLGTDSPLLVLNDTDWTATETAIGEALVSHKAAEFHKGEMEKEYRNRDTRMENIDKALKRSIALLKASFAENPKKLSDWGVNIDDSAPVRKKKSAAKKEEE